MATQHGFWIDATDNRVFDGIVTRHLIAHGDIVAINAFYQSPAFYQPPAYSFADIVRRLKAASSAVRVLFYTWAGRKRTGADMIGAVPTLDVLGDYSVEGGCYRRAFERGLVLVVPFESTGPVSVLIEQPMFTPEGRTPSAI